MCQFSGVLLHSCLLFHTLLVIQVHSWSKSERKVQYRARETQFAATVEDKMYKTYCYWMHLVYWTHPSYL